MLGLPSEKQNKIYNLLTNMRELKDDDKSCFEDYLPEAWELLGLKSNKSLVSFEALLIEAVMNITIHKKGVSADKYDKYREAVQKCDAYLLALGLLEGYYHTGKNGTPYIAADRHKDYLSKSDYMELVCPTFKSTDNINIDDAQSKPRRNISQDDKRCRQYLSKHLSTAANCQQCLIDGIKNHTHMVELNGHKKREIKLPEPCFTLDNPSLFTEQDYNSKSGSLSTEDELDDMPITNIEETDDKGTQELGGSEAEPIDPNPPEPSPYGAGWFGIFMGKFKVKLTAIKQLLSSASLHLPKASSITLVIAVSALAIMGIKLVSIIENMNTTKEKEISQAKEEVEKIVPTKIEIMEKNIILPLGGEDYLKVETAPIELNQNDLCYTSSWPDVVRMENVHSKHMIATNELAAGARNYSDIVVHDVDDIVQDTATVIVGGPRKNEAAIDDKNDDEASSTGFESNIDSE